MYFQPKILIFLQNLWVFSIVFFCVGNVWKCVQGCWFSLCWFFVPTAEREIIDIGNESYHTTSYLLYREYQGRIRHIFWPLDRLFLLIYDLFSDWWNQSFFLNPVCSGDNLENEIFYPWENAKIGQHVILWYDMTFSLLWPSILEGAIK